MTFIQIHTSDDKTSIVGAPGRRQSHTLFVEKEVMTPYTIGELTHGTAPSGRIRHGNPEFANVDGPAPMFGFGPD
jgi:hypothetical protein